MEKFTEYNLTQKYGMEGVGDMEMEWLTPKEQEERWEQNKQYVENCKADGSYGKEYTTKISIQHDPTLDYTHSSTKSHTSSSAIIWNPSEYVKPKIEIKKYEIWIGFVPSWGQGYHDSTAPNKLAEVEAKSFEIACCIYEHESKLKTLRDPNYYKDSWFGHWGYNAKGNSTFHLGKFFETEQEAWETFKNK
jgi:hypothetical protein